VRVLALRATEIALDAEMRVQATAESWESESALPILRTAGPGRALVTGASGAIGGAVALALASTGWALLLQDRGDDPRRKALRASLDRLGARVDFVAADLTTASGRATLAGAVTERDDVEIVVHAASPGLKAPLDELVAVNYRAFKEITDAALPAMLARQKGRLLFIGSTAMLRGLPGWEDYAAAKAMGGGLASGLDHRFAGFGVRGLVLMPGYVATAFSAETRGDSPALLPQEVAAAALAMVESPDSPAVVLEVGRFESGRLGLASPQDPRRAAPPTETVPEVSAASASSSIEDAVRHVLRLPRGTSLAGGGMGITPEWDSLRQIEIVLALESALGVRFTSAELAELNRFDSLLAACTRKQGDK
jgi:short-subunit dehydrogenase